MPMKPSRWTKLRLRIASRKINFFKKTKELIGLPKRVPDLREEFTRIFESAKDNEFSDSPRRKPIVIMGDYIKALESAKHA